MAKDLADKEIIVTGGMGFIGSNLVERISNNNVYVIDNLHTGKEYNLKDFVNSKNIKFINDDSKNILKHNLKANLVFHLGIYSASPMYRENPSLVGEVVLGMINILEFARKYDINVVFASTSSIYNGINPPHREDIVPKVTDYYTEARIACERISELYNKLYGLNIAAMRFFSVYGKHEESKGKYANLVTQFLWSMKKGESPVIYGNGEQRRDFIFVEDVVNAMILASSVKGFEIFNVGTGKNYSLNELVEMLNKALGTNIKPKYIEMPVKNYVMETLADTKKARNVLGFDAKVSLDDGIKIINEYYSKI